MWFCQEGWGCRLSSLLFSYHPRCLLSRVPVWRCTILKGLALAVCHEKVGVFLPVFGGVVLMQVAPIVAVPTLDSIPHSEDRSFLRVLQCLHRWRPKMLSQSKGDRGFTRHRWSSTSLLPRVETGRPTRLRTRREIWSGRRPDVPDVWQGDIYSRSCATTDDGPRAESVESSTKYYFFSTVETILFVCGEERWTLENVSIVARLWGIPF